jgi:cobalt/nickel transport system ATP-binding protein
VGALVVSGLALSVRGLRFSYGAEHVALRGVDLDLAEGEKVALLGPNGAGKSTLMLHLNGLLRGEGTVRVGDVEVRPETLATVRAKVGLVFQDADDQLFCPTVFDDVAFGPLYMGLDEAAVRERVGKALEAVGMGGAGGRVPYQLSGGEKKRVSIATVLSMEPSILVLDEPTAGLDPRGRRELMELLRSLPQTMLVATHDLDMARDLCTRVVVLDAGQVVADGPAAEVLADVALLEAHGLRA